MAEEKTPKSESQKAPYVAPKILTLKVDLSFASSATNFEDIIDLKNPLYERRQIAGLSPVGFERRLSQRSATR